MHHFGPITQRIQYQTHHIGVFGIDRSAATGTVIVISLVFGIERIVRGIVNTAITKGRSQLIALAGMIVNDVKYHFQPVPVIKLDHIFKFVDIVARQIRLFGRKKAAALIAPVIVAGKTLLMAVAEISMDRQQFHRGYAQPFKITGNRFRPHAGKGTAATVRNFGMQLGKTAHMRFINNCFVKSIAGSPVPFPIVKIVNHDRLGYIRRTVQLVKRQILVRTVGVVTENRLMPNQLAAQLLSVRIKQQFVGIEAMPFFRFVRSVYPVTVNLSRFQSGNIHVPNIVIIAFNGDTVGLFGSAFIEQTQFHF